MANGRRQKTVSIVNERTLKKRRLRDAFDDSRINVVDDDDGDVDVGR
jgi:hypothetical protein